MQQAYAGIAWQKALLCICGIIILRKHWCERDCREI
jgi:hypothetical protein